MAADQSDKWHHSISRYLGLDSDNDFLFGVQPGVCREAIGRYDWIYTMADCFNSKKNYFWSDFHYKKASTTSRVSSYYGLCPFLWDLGKIATENTFDPEGSLFFLPRDDQVTIRCEEWETVQDWIDWAPRPITFLVPWRTCDIWKNWEKLKFPKDSNVVQMSDRSTRQFVLSKLLLQHKNVYIPWPGTDIYYAEFLEKNVIVYDHLENYRTKTPDEMERQNRVLNHLKWGYDYLNDMQKEYFHYTEKWSDLPTSDRQFLTAKMLGLDALKSPRELYYDMQEKNLLPPGEFNDTGDYDLSYNWLKKKTEKFVNSSCSSTCATIYDKL